MSKVQMVRALVKQRLTAAVEEIFGLFERTIAEYEEQLCRSKEENERQRKLLDAVFNPQLQLHRADVQQLSVVKEEVPPEQQECSSSLDQEDPELPHIKEEQEELWSSQEGEQLQVLEEADITKFTFTSVPVNDEGCNTGGESCSCSECGRRCDNKASLERHMRVHTGEKPFTCSVCGHRFSLWTNLMLHMTLHTAEKTSTSCVSDTEATNTHRNIQGPGRLTPEPGVSSQTEVRDQKHNPDMKSFICAECGKIFGNRTNFMVHMRVHTGEKPFSCSVCQKGFSQKPNLIRHMKQHTRKNPFGCSVRGQKFNQKANLICHMTGHTGEKPFSCPVCKKCFKYRGAFVKHKRLHTREKPSTSQRRVRATRVTNIHKGPETEDKTGDSSVAEIEVSCDDWKETREPQSGSSSVKKDTRTRKKKLSCSVCGKLFGQNSNLQIHMRVHTGEKPFSCSVCGNEFSQRAHVESHMKRHTGEKPFSCPVCQRCFGYKASVVKHMKTHKRKEHCRGKQSTQECSSSLDQEDPEPPHIKEEQEELWSSQEGEQLQGLEEADITKFTFSPDPVKSEDDEEKPQSSQMETEADGEDCGGPQPDRNSHPDTHVTPETEDKTGDSSEPETDDSDDWTETREPQSGLNSLKDDEVPVSDSRCRAGEKPFSCLECDTKTKNTHKNSESLKAETEEKPGVSSQTEVRDQKHNPDMKSCVCPECGKIFSNTTNLKVHMIIHSREKPFSCTLCGKGFSQKANLISHMPHHTGEKPYSCPVCKKYFRSKAGLWRHRMTVCGVAPGSWHESSFY